MERAPVHLAAALVLLALATAAEAKLSGPLSLHQNRQEAAPRIFPSAPALLRRLRPGGAGVGERSDGLSMANRTERIARRIIAWWRRAQPVILLLTASAVAQHMRANADKKGEFRDIRSQVINMEDFHIAIVTTAALPWMTGTAINPLLRAAYLARAGKRVTLAVPWVHPKEQALIFPGQLRFSTPEDQEAHIRVWLHQRGGVKADFKLRFYPARYDLDRGSILPLGDITRVFSESESDICVLEEPEHLNWYHSGANWRHRFKLVVGVVHTNYIYYAKMYLGPAHAAMLQRLNVWMCGAYCDKVIKLSDTIQPLPRAVVCNVHGVRAEFLEIGRRAARSILQRRSGAYFLGKVLWPKGHRLLLDYLKLQKELGLPSTHLDIYGGGEDLEEVKAEVRRSGVDISFFKATDHSSVQLRQYKAFINPSQSEVLSTTTAEALAMGKFVVLQRHPSNDFFLQFRNTLAYDTASEFLQQLEHALAADPAPLSPQERRALSWEGATDRFLEAIGNCTLSDVLPTIGDHTTRCGGHWGAGWNWAQSKARLGVGEGQRIAMAWVKGRRVSLGQREGRFGCGCTKARAGLVSLHLECRAACWRASIMCVAKRRQRPQLSVPAGPLQVRARERSKGRPNRRRLPASNRRRAHFEAKLAHRGPLPLRTNDRDCGSQHAGLPAGGVARTGGSHAAIFAPPPQQVARRPACCRGGAQPCQRRPCISGPRVRVSPSSILAQYRNRCTFSFSVAKIMWIFLENTPAAAPMH